MFQTLQTWFLKPSTGVIQNVMVSICSLQIHSLMSKMVAQTQSSVDLSMPARCGASPIGLWRAHSTPLTRAKRASECTSEHCTQELWRLDKEHLQKHRKKLPPWHCEEVATTLHHHQQIRTLANTLANPMGPGFLLMCATWVWQLLNNARWGWSLSSDLGKQSCHDNADALLWWGYHTNPPSRSNIGVLASRPPKNSKPHN